MKILGCEFQHGLIILGILRCRKLSHRLTGLRSAVGERGKWSGRRREVPNESQPERNGPPPGRRRKPFATALNVSGCRP